MYWSGIVCYDRPLHHNSSLFSLHFHSSKSSSSMFTMYDCTSIIIHRCVHHHVLWPKYIFFHQFLSLLTNFICVVNNWWWILYWTRCSSVLCVPSVLCNGSLSWFLPLYVHIFHIIWKIVYFRVMLLFTC